MYKLKPKIYKLSPKKYKLSSKNTNYVFRSSGVAVLILKMYSYKKMYYCSLRALHNSFLKKNAARKKKQTGSSGAKKKFPAKTKKRGFNGERKK